MTEEFETVIGRICLISASNHALQIEGDERWYGRGNKTMTFASLNIGDEVILKVLRDGDANWVRKYEPRKNYGKIDDSTPTPKSKFKTKNELEDEEGVTRLDVVIDEEVALWNKIYGKLPVELISERKVAVATAIYSKIK